MTELYINGNKVDFEINDNKEFEYKIQVHDLASVESVNTSYTTSFRLPKTKRNVEIFRSLGLTGSISNLPYKKTSARLVVDGVTLIANGWLRINNTTSEAYEVNIEDGILDFFAAIANKNIGDEVDLEELNHEKNMESVITSFQNQKPYLYILANYNGLTNVIRNNQTYINIDYMTPSVKVSWLLNKIFSTFGYTYSGSIFSSDDFAGLYMTYPKSPPIKSNTDVPIDPKLVATIQFNNSRTYMTSSWDDEFIQIPLPVTTIPDAGASVIDQFYFTVAESGTYRFTNLGYDGEDEYNYEDPNDQRDPRRKQNQNLVLRVDSIYGATSSNARITARLRNNQPSSHFDLPLQAGERIGFRYYIRYENRDNWELDHIEIENFNLRIEQVSTGQIDFGEELTKFSITDFFKEILWRFSLTPFINNETKNIHFLTLDERINSSQVIDWSDKYISRSNEEYELGDYNRKNLFKHKYNDSNASYNDGSINVNNENLNEVKTLVDSKIYTYNNVAGTLLGVYPVLSDSYTYPIWQQEAKEVTDNNGNSSIKIEYKDLTDRYYFLSCYHILGNVLLGSPSFNIYTSTNEYSVIRSTDTTYSELIPKYYTSFEKIANTATIHTISLALTPVDIANIDLKSLLYFGQESAYYLLNSLTFKPNGASVGEFIKIHR